MVPIISLWLPILLSSVFVFLLSYVLHTVLEYHFKDFRGVNDEDKIMDVVRSLNIPPGEYIVPYAGSRKVFNTPEYQEKMKKGPAVTLTVWPSGPPEIGKNLVQWFAYTLIVGVFAAYVAGRALEPGEAYGSVFRFTGVTAFACYTVAQWQDYIWLRRSMRRTVTGFVDGLLYALVTAGTFGWLWPE